jgi:hypothetical protein
MVVITILVLIYFGLNSSVTSSIMSQETQPLQEAVDIKDNIVKCWGEMSFFSVNSADINKCFSSVQNKITGYRVEVVNFLGCNQSDFNAKEFGNTMNCKTRIPLIISLKKDEKSTCVGRMTLCFNESKRIQSNYVPITDNTPPATTVSGCENGQSVYSTTSEKLTFSCRDDVACKKLTYTIDSVPSEYTYDISQSAEIFLYPSSVDDKNFTIKFHSQDSSNNTETPDQTYYCAIKKQVYVPPQVQKVYLSINGVENEVIPANKYEVESRQSVVVKGKVNKPMVSVIFSVDYPPACSDKNFNFGLEPSLIGDYNYYGQWVVPASSCNGSATGKIIFTDETGARVDSSTIKFDINSRPFDVNITSNNLLDFNIYQSAIGRSGRITNIVAGVDLNKSSCYFSVNGGINWIKADWNDSLNGCDSKTIDLVQYGTNFSFNTKISNIYNETAFGTITPTYYLDINAPSISLFPSCPSYPFITETTVNFYCNDYPSPKNSGCGAGSVYYRIDGGTWNNINSGGGKLFGLDGNYLTEAYSVDRFGYRSPTFSTYCSLSKQKLIYLYSTEIKESNLYISAYQLGGTNVDLYADTNNLDTLSPTSGQTVELTLPIYHDVVGGSKLKICFPGGDCSQESNVFEIKSGEKGGLVQYCGGSFISDRATNSCLFSEFGAISDINTSTCEYSLDGNTYLPATYGTYNTKQGCKVTIPQMLFGKHYILFKITKNDLNTVNSQSSRATVAQNSLTISCRYADCA